MAASLQQCPMSDVHNTAIDREENAAVWQWNEVGYSGKEGVDGGHMEDVRLL